MTEKYNHYFKDCPYGKIDIYRVLEIFNVTDPCLQHIVKKALVAGQRGMKDFETDIKEIRDTTQRKLNMLEEDKGIMDISKVINEPISTGEFL